jgi:predicted transposase YbfD/YdcC
MVEPTRIRVEEIIPYFESLEDPRSEINQRHPLESVLVISLLAVLALAKGPTAIAAWANDKKSFLLPLLPLPNGIPQKDVFRRVLSGLKPEAFQACFANWLTSLRAQAAEASEVEQPVFAVDGKTLRRSHDRQNGLGALHSVSVWATDYGLTLGQVATEEKSNEITAIPELLRLVDIQGAIITIDAMGTQKAIAKQIVEAKADYLLALKGNQDTIHQGVVSYVDKQLNDNFQKAEGDHYTTTDKGHGREETRTYIQMPAPKSLPGFGLWKGLQTIGLVISLCLRDGKETSETRYYLSSLPMGVQQFAHAIRSHWGIENTCHWSLDMTYREDESRIRDANLRENFAWLNRFTLSLLKQHPSKESLAMKRNHCAWNERFLMEALAGKAI